MPRPWPQPPPRNTTSPGAVAGGIVAPPEGGQSAAWAAPAAEHERGDGEREGEHQPAGRAQHSGSAWGGWGWWDVGTAPL